MSKNRESIHRLIICRFSLVCALIVATRWALPEGSLLDKLYPYFLGTAALTVLFLLLWKYSDKDQWLYQLQFYTDLVLVTSLIVFSGGVDSLFSPLYVLIIVYASLLQGRSGGILGLVLSVLSFASIAHLSYFDLLPGAQGPVDLERVLYRFSINVLAFVAVAFLGIYLSERLLKARQELGSARVIQQNIVDSIRSGLLTLNEDGQINFANRVGAEILGWQREELLDLSLDEVFPANVLSRIKTHDYGTTSRALRMEEWVETRPGEVLFVGMGCSPLLTQGGERVGFVISFQDLTEIREREEDYQFREKMAAIGEMAAGLAHELRNPLGSLSGSIQILKSELNLSRDQSRLLDIVLRESERLNRIVGDFLTYAGPQTSVRQKVDFWAIIEETVQLLRNTPEFLGDKHTVKLTLGNGERHCMGNPDQFRQVIWNVLQNGIRAMPEGGTLSVGLDSRNDMLAFRVQDNGIGMSRSAQERLFQPFHSGFSKGAGLGMAIVYQIVQQHQGRIEVESAPKIGTRIDVLLPKA